MSQPLFKDPIVSTPIVSTGVGNGSVSVDKLTHFTTAQTYTLTCIAKSPDTIFSVIGSLDGPVGLVTVGQQFFDEDLKIFLTITQGSTVFEVGDNFVFSVINGTDLNQDNIDDYDEIPQKNFGTGVKGTTSGDHNIRFSDDDIAAYLFFQDLKFTAVAAGPGGNDIQIQYMDPVPGVQATGTKQGIDFTSVDANAAANGISIEFIPSITPVQSEVTIQNVNYRADNFGVAGDSISIEYTTGAIAGSEVVSVISNAITVQIESGVSTPTQIANAVNGFPAAAALVDATVTPISSTTPQTGPVAQTFLAGGVDGVGLAGFEEVYVTGQAIQVRLENGVSTIDQVIDALDAEPLVAALVTYVLSGSGSALALVAPPTFLTNGADPYGYSGSEEVQVTGNLIQVFMESGKSSASVIKAVVDGFPAAAALVTVTLLGSGNEYQEGPVAATNLENGESKFFSFNQHELTEAGDFYEGNASILAKDAHFQGDQVIDGNTENKGKVSWSDPDSGPAIPNAQSALNKTIHNQVLNPLVDGGVLSHSSTTVGLISWSADLNIKPLGSSAVITIEDGSIQLADGEVAYVDLSEPLATGIKTLNKVSRTAAFLGELDRYWVFFRSGTVIYTRGGDTLFQGEESEADGLFGGIATDENRLTVPKNSLANLNALTRKQATLLYDTNGDRLLLDDGVSLRPVGSGGSVKVDLYDMSATTLPTTTAYIIDDETIFDGALVVFDSLTVNPNRIYRATVVGINITWVAQGLYSNGVDPVVNDEIRVRMGTGFQYQLGVFDGTTFRFNNFVRYFNGLDYFEQSAIASIAISPSTTDTVFSLSYTQSENVIADFSILRGSVKEVGTIHITTDGTDAVLSVTGTSLGSSGVTFSAAIVGSDLVLSYTSDASGTGSIKIMVRRWANAAGGPAGIPNYGVPSGPLAPAAGSNGQIQFNGAGNLAADSSFTFDLTNKVLQLNGLNIVGLQLVSLLDNQASPVVAVTYDKALYPFVIIEFSILRDSDRKVGRLLITNNGSSVSMTEDSAPLGDVGVTLSAAVNGPNIEISYISTNTGFNAQLKHSARRWA